MRVAARLGAMRARAESMHMDTFAAYSPADDSVADADGFVAAGYRFEGETNGKIAGPSYTTRDTTARHVVIGGTERPVVHGGLHISVSAPAPAAGEYGIGWEYVLTELGPDTDESLLNSRWLVVDAPAKSYATARRLDVVRLV